MKAFFDWLNQSDERKGWRIAVIALVVLSAGLGLRDPWPPDEPALALMAKYIADSGQWLIPYFNGVPFSEHPPFAIWLQAAFYDTTGSMRLSFILPALLASLGTLWLVYDLAKTLWGPRTGRLAATALLCSIQFMVQAHRGQVDAVLMFWTTLALYSLLQYMLVENTRRWLTVAGVAMGFGVLTKGVGYLPALIIIPYAWMYRQSWPELPAGRSMGAFWSAAAACVIVVLAWALPALAFVSGADDPDLDQFRRQFLLNLAGGVNILDVTAHHPWWYLPVQALLLWLPLTLMLPWKFRIWRDRLKAKDPLIGLLLGYVITSLLLFSVLPGRQGVQLLVLLPAVALLMAPYLGGLWWRPGVQRLSVVTLVVASLLIIAAGLIGHESELWAGKVPYPSDIPNLLWNFLLALGVSGLVICVVMRGRSQAMGLPVFFFVGWLMLGYWAYPTLNHVRTSHVIFDEAQNWLQADDEIATWDWSPQIQLFAPGPLHQLSGPQAALPWLSAGEGRWLLSESADVASLHQTMQSNGLAGLEIHELDLRHKIHWALARLAPQ